VRFGAAIIGFLIFFSTGLEAQSPEAWQRALMNYVKGEASPLNGENFAAFRDYVGEPTEVHELYDDRMHIVVLQNKNAQYVIMAWSKSPYWESNLREEIRAFFDTWIVGVESERDLSEWKDFRASVMRAYLKAKEVGILQSFCTGSSQFTTSLEDPTLGSAPKIFRFPKSIREAGPLAQQRISP